MRARATMTSKGQITVPVRIRREMGLREGDVVEFTFKKGVTILERHVDDENPFEKWAGKLGGMNSLEEVIQWQRDLRDEA